MRRSRRELSERSLSEYSPVQQNALRSLANAPMSAWALKPLTSWSLIDAGLVESCVVAKEYACSYCGGKGHIKTEETMLRLTPKGASMIGAPHAED